MLYMSWVSAGVSVLLGVSLGWFLEQHSELLSRCGWQEPDWLAGCPKPQGYWVRGTLFSGSIQELSVYSSGLCGH